MTDEVTNEVRQERAALLWALSVLTEDVRFQGEVYRWMAGRGPAAWTAMLMRAAQIIADSTPRHYAEGLDLTDSPAQFTRDDAANNVRAQLERLTVRNGALLAVDDVDESDLGHLDAALRALLDDEGGTS